MAWSDKTKPTRANVKKRLNAALEANSAAADLYAKLTASAPHQRRDKVAASLVQVDAWIRSTLRDLEAQKGKRT
jgi:hypothetical protein